LGVLPIDCLDYRLMASLVESIGDRSVQIASKVVKLKGVKLPKKLLQLVLRFHRLVYEAHENALRAVFSRSVSVAESVTNERQNVLSVFGEVEAEVGGLSVDVATHVLAVASLMNRIYDNSVDIADLVMPKHV
jgi:phosphate uptake regulator